MPISALSLKQRKRLHTHLQKKNLLEKNATNIGLDTGLNKRVQNYL